MDFSFKFFKKVSIFLFLTTIFLVRLGWTQESLEELVKTRLSPNGKTLDLSGLKGHLKLGVAEAKKLASMASLSKVTKLMLQGNRIKYRGFKALTESPYFANLRNIDLWGNMVGDLGIKALAESPYVKKHCLAGSCRSYQKN